VDAVDVNPHNIAADLVDVCAAHTVLKHTQNTEDAIEAQDAKGDVHCCS
jgi:hypothetical protein